MVTILRTCDNFTLLLMRFDNNLRKITRRLRNIPFEKKN